MSKSASDLSEGVGGPGFTLWRVSNAWQRAVQNYRGTLWPTFASLESAWVMK